MSTWHLGFEALPALTAPRRRTFWPTQGCLRRSHCWESLRVSKAVKFGIANFPTLFGTADGRELQLMAERLRWPLPLGLTVDSCSDF